MLEAEIFTFVSYECHKFRADHLISGGRTYLKKAGTFKYYFAACPQVNRLPPKLFFRTLLIFRVDLSTCPHGFVCRAIVVDFSWISIMQTSYIVVLRKERKEGEKSACWKSRLWRKGARWAYPSESRIAERDVLMPSYATRDCQDDLFWWQLNAIWTFSLPLFF